MQSLATRLFVIAALVLAAATAMAEGKPYAEGPVVYFSYIKIMPGQYDAYLKYLATMWKPIMEEQKKAGLILDFSVYHNVAPEADEPDVILATTYPNMAALDDQDAKLDPLVAKAWGSMEQAGAAKVERSKLRTDLGGDLFRKLILK